MFVKFHILLGAIFSFLVWLIFPSIEFSGFLIIFLSSVLIDFDHYLLYLFEKRDFNLKKAYWYCRFLGDKNNLLPKNIAKKVYTPLCFFHGIEFILLLSILGIYFKTAVFILIGCIFHMSMDHLLSSSQALVFPDKNAYRHPIIPTYRFIKRKKLIHIEKI